MVRNILDIEKLQAGETLPTNKVSCDLNKLADGVLEIVQAEANAKRISLRHELAEEMPTVMMDRLQMERVLLNLLSNAVKYSPLDAAVVMKTSANSRYVRVDLVDTGYGIPASEIPYIFERFRRVKQLKDRATGTGLGLAITKALVEQHGGMISVVSEVGQGSTFTVKLPL